MSVDLMTGGVVADKKDAHIVKGRAELAHLIRKTENVNWHSGANILVLHLQAGIPCRSFGRIQL
jgi:hypothetical protein